jgi:hypothetical protein
MTNSTRLIRTPDQRLRVFVSSMLQELADERQAIERLRLTPVLFELGARPHPPQELDRVYLDQSHIFIGLYWQKYGWVAPDREPRLTELLDRIRRDGRVSYKSFTTAQELRDLITLTGPGGPSPLRGGYTCTVQARNAVQVWPGGG